MEAPEAPEAPATEPAPATEAAAPATEAAAPATEGAAPTEGAAVATEGAAPTEAAAASGGGGGRGGSVLAVTVSYGTKKHNLQVASQEEDKELTVRDMAVLIEQVTGVPVAFQKLIYKGRSLKELEQPLSAYGVKNGCRVMLIGKRISPEEEDELKKLKDLEKSVEQIARKIQEVNRELRDIQKGFLAKNLQAEALAQLDKRIKATAEQFMKILEEIDAIELPEAFGDCKQKKKVLVKKIQAFLAQCDTVEGSIGQEMDKQKSKNVTLAE